MYIFWKFHEDKFEVTNGVIRSHESKRDGRYNGQKDQQCSTKHYTEHYILGNTNHTTIQTVQTLKDLLEESICWNRSPPLISLFPSTAPSILIRPLFYLRSDGRIRWDYCTCNIIKKNTDLKIMKLKLYVSLVILLILGFSGMCNVLKCT